MTDFVSYLTEKVDERRMLNEATETELTKEVFELYSVLFENLSDAFYDMSNKSNVDGNGKVSEDLRKAEVAIVAIKKKLKTITNSKSKDKFESSTNKSIGEIANSLKILKKKVDQDLLPIFEVEPEPTFSPDETDVTGDETEDEIIGGK
jgi:hypothetical protein